MEGHPSSRADGTDVSDIIKKTPPTGKSMKREKEEAEGGGASRGSRMGGGLATDTKKNDRGKGVNGPRDVSRHRKRGGEEQGSITEGWRQTIAGTIIDLTRREAWDVARERGASSEINRKTCFLSRAARIDHPVVTASQKKKKKTKRGGKERSFGLGCEIYSNHVEAKRGEHR